MCFSAFQFKKKYFTKLQLPFVLALSLTNLFAFSKTSTMDGVLNLFQENVYFMKIYKLITHETFKLILLIEQLT